MSSRPTRNSKVPPKTAAKPSKTTPPKTPPKQTMKKAEEPKVEEAKEKIEKAQGKKEELKKEVGDLKEQLESMQSEYDEMLNNMEREGKEQGAERVARVRAEINAQVDRSLDNNFADMTHRFKESKQKVDHQKTDILRMNKIFRDVARCLGTNWRSVFEVLTLEWSPQVTDMHLSKIEAQRPFMQAYKALMAWKELVGDKFDMMKLVDALRKCNLNELAAATLETMTTEGDSLMTLGKVGLGIAPGVDRQTSYEGGEGGENREGAPRGAAATPSGTDLEGPLGNRLLLQLARSVGGSWADLGRELMVPKEELDEVLQVEGMTYQGAFKILWGWRDRNQDAMHQDNVEILKTALKKTGRGELIEQVGL